MFNFIFTSSPELINQIIIIAGVVLVVTFILFYLYGRFYDSDILVSLSVLSIIVLLLCNTVYIAASKKADAQGFLISMAASLFIWVSVLSKRFRKKGIIHLRKVLFVPFKVFKIKPVSLLCLSLSCVFLVLVQFMSPFDSLRLWDNVEVQASDAVVASAVTADLAGEEPKAATDAPVDAVQGEANEQRDTTQLESNEQRDTVQPEPPSQPDAAQFEPNEQRDTAQPESNEQRDTVRIEPLAQSDTAWVESNEQRDTVQSESYEQRDTVQSAPSDAAPLTPARPISTDNAPEAALVSTAPTSTSPPPPAPASTSPPPSDSSLPEAEQSQGRYENVRAGRRGYYEEYIVPGYYEEVIVEGYYKEGWIEGYYIEADVSDGPEPQAAGPQSPEPEGYYEEYWVDGYYKDVWVAGYYEPVYTEGYYESVWVEGYYEDTWVEGYYTSDGHWVEGYFEQTWVDGYNENIWVDGSTSNVWVEGYADTMWVDGYPELRWVEGRADEPSADTAEPQWVEGHMGMIWVPERTVRIWIPERTETRWVEN